MEYKFNAEAARDEAISFIKHEAEAAKFSKVVLGISGGKDSTIAAALCCRALGKENVHGLSLPNGMQKDIDDSIGVCKALGIDYDTINIKPMYDAFMLQYGLCTMKSDVEVVQDDAGCIHFRDSKSKDVYMEKVSKEAAFNLPPRIRMSMIRLWGQSNHHRMCGTGNLSEITVGYCTKDGDTSNDFNPLGGLTSVEVVQIGLTMEEIPQKYVIKTPDDGLSGMSDEEKLGVSYNHIHGYIRGLDIPKEEWYKINNLERLGMHKRTKSIFIPSRAVLGV